jgi:acylphosphatase
MLKHLNITLFGNVQGVFLRRTVKHEATRKGISGFVRNEPDGTVYIEAEGSEQAVGEFVQWLKSGAAPGDGDYEIKDVDVVEGSFKAFDRFEVKE